MSENGNPDELGGWRPVVDVEGKQNIATGEGFAAGKVDMAQSTEVRPCMTCRSWERDERRLIEFLLARGFELRPDGIFVTPIAKDFPGRKSMELNPKHFGWCAQWAHVAEDLHTCERWSGVVTRSELASRIAR